MWLVLVWVVLSIFLGVAAARRDRHGFIWFLLSLVISPVIAALFLLLMGENRRNRCPFCDECVRANAKICPHCRSDIRPVGDILIEGEERARVRPKSPRS